MPAVATYLRNIILWIGILFFFSYSQSDKNIQQRVLQLRSEGYFFPLTDNGKIESPGPVSFLDSLIFLSETEKDIIRIGKSIEYKKLKQLYISYYNSIVNKGYPFCVFKKISYKVTGNKNELIRINAYVQVDSGPKVRIRDIWFTGIKYTSDKYLKRVMQFKQDVVFQTRRIRGYIKKLERLDYIELNGSPVLIQKDSLYFLKIPLKENNLINFDFIVGYSPGTAQQTKGIWSGRIFFHFKNLFGSGRRLKISWEKPDRISETLNLNYQEKYIFGSNLNMDLAFAYRVKDSLFSSSTRSIGLEYPFHNFSFGLVYQERNSTLDSSVGVSYGSIKIRNRAVRLAFQFNSFNNQVNPTSGMRIQIENEFGNYEGQDSTFKQLFWKYSFSFSKIMKLYQFYPFLGLIYRKTGSNINIPASELYFVGGSTSLRGYSEEQFRTDEYALLSLEMRFILGRYSRFHIFGDMAWLKSGNKFLNKNGYGIGFLIPMKLGVLKIDYGLQRGFQFREGTLHIRVISEF